MVFLRVISKTLYICNRIEWRFSLTKCWGERLVCVFLLCWYLLCDHFSVILCIDGVENPLLCPCFCTCENSMSWLDTFEWNASHNNSSKQMQPFYVLSQVALGSVCFWMTLTLGVVASMDCNTICEWYLWFTNC